MRKVSSVCSPWWAQCWKWLWCFSSQLSDSHHPLPLSLEDRELPSKSVHLDNNALPFQPAPEKRYHMIKFEHALFQVHIRRIRIFRDTNLLACFWRVIHKKNMFWVSLFIFSDTRLRYHKVGSRVCLARFYCRFVFNFDRRSCRDK